MFESFFPKPRLFFISAAVWALVAIVLWYVGGNHLGAYIGLPPLPPAPRPVIGAAVFWSPPFLRFYVYFAVAITVFAGFWALYSPHRWQRWSVLGTALIVFNSYLSVQVSAAVNAWYGPFYDLIQQALAKTTQVTAAQLDSAMIGFAGIAFLAIRVVFGNLSGQRNTKGGWKATLAELLDEREAEAARRRVPLPASACKSVDCGVHEDGARRH